MNAFNVDSFVAVPLSTELYAEFTRRYPGRANSVLENVAQDFLDRTADDYKPLPTKERGIHWISPLGSSQQKLFLAEGTQIRTKYRGEYKTATIQGEAIIWENKTYPTMSQLAYAMRGKTSNNAWKVLEIKRPSDTTWTPADSLRWATLFGMD
jgi:hypothetical protein